MKMKRLIIMPLALASMTASAQITAFSAMHFGLEDPVLGNARYQGMAGAMSALGGNSSVMKDNPGALATSTSSDINFTANVYANNDSKCSFNVNDASILFNIDHGSKGYMSTAIGIGYNRVANFDRQRYTKTLYTYNDNNTVGEGTDDNVELGGSGELNIAYAGNINNVVFFGVDFSFSNIKYINKDVYMLSSYGNAGNWDRDWLLPDDYYRKSDGWGFNFKAGLVLQPTNFMRIGASIQTPTKYYINEYWDFYCESEEDGNTDYVGGEDNRYELHVPFKFTGSLGFMIGDKVNLGFDYSMRNYAQTWAAISHSTIRYLEENLEALGQKQHTVRAGIEVNVVGGLDLRLGYALATEPMKKMTDVDEYANTKKGNIINGLYVDSYWAENDKPRYSFMATGQRQYITAGFGYTGKHFYADFAYAHKISKDEYLEQIPNVMNDDGKFEIKSHEVTNKSNNFTLTIGLRW